MDGRAIDVTTRVLAGLLVAVALGACSSPGVDVAADPVTETVASSVTDDVGGASESSTSTHSEPSIPTAEVRGDPGEADPPGAKDDVDQLEADVLIAVDAPSRPIDPRLFGTNVPAWAGPQKLADPAFRARAVESGATLIRMPGGSWSNSYDWLACEQGDDDGCYWPWAARPSDFIDFLHGTGLAGSWTVNINETAQAAAAAVAFFNGDPGDDRSIGTDRAGVDWGTVGDWAQLRVDNGNVQPADIEVWEVGNEVFGGRPDAGGEQCATFGWEDVWTCDGAEYVLGDSDHDGYLAIRAAMLAVDADIDVGAVGVAPPSEWGDFGSKVIEAAGDDLDFYVVHRYGFDRSPSGSEALGKPDDLWPALIAGVRAELGGDIPIALTEYNLVAFESGDTERTMTTSQNALYMADTLGQLAVGGVAIANQWNLANGVTASGTDYGLIDAETYEPYPQWEALRVWAQAGDALLPVSTGDDLRLYPTQHDDGRLTVVAINLAETATTRSIAFDGLERPQSATLHTVRTDDLAAAAMITDPPVEHGPLDGSVEVSFPGWSISRLEIAASE